jgi:hypothetical protein
MIDKFYERSFFAETNIWKIINQHAGFMNEWLHAIEMIHNQTRKMKSMRIEKNVLFVKMIHSRNFLLLQLRHYFD